MTFFRFIAFATLMLSSAVCNAAKKLNVVLIMADDVGYECFSAYGSKEFSTPRLDALAAKGMLFDHCHSTPLCTPSRVNLMTGKSNVFNYVDFGVFPKANPPSPTTSKPRATQRPWRASGSC